MLKLTVVKLESQEDDDGRKAGGYQYALDRESEYEASRPLLVSLLTFIQRNPKQCGAMCAIHWFPHNLLGV